MNVIQLAVVKESDRDENTKVSQLEKRLSKDFRIQSPTSFVKLNSTKSQQLQKFRKDSYSSTTTMNSPILKGNILSNSQTFGGYSLDLTSTLRSRQASYNSQISYRNNSNIFTPTSSNKNGLFKKYLTTEGEQTARKDSVNEVDSFDDSDLSDDSDSQKVYQNKINQNEFGDLEIDEWSTLNLEDIFKLFEAKCKDNKLPILHSQLYIFVDKLKTTLQRGKLDLTEQQLGIEAAKMIVKILRRNAKSQCPFSSLILGKNKFGDEGIMMLCKLLRKQNLTSIMNIDFSNNNLSSHGMKNIINMISLNENIVSLDISSYEGYNRNRLSRQSCIQLSNFLAKTQILQFLKMQNCCIGPHGLFSLSKGFSVNKSIISLDISKNDIGKDCASFIESILVNSKIMELNLRGNMIEDTSIEKIGECLKPGLKMCVLNILDVSNNKLTSLGLNHFFDCLQKNQYLEKLIIDQNSLRGGLEDFVQFMQENNNITYLSMNDCYIQPDVVESIATGISRNSSLKTLLLSKNFIKDQGAQLIAQSLRADLNLITNKKLKVLDLSRCAIEELGGQVLADAFKSHPGITDVDLRHNLLGDASGFSMIDLVRNNQKITKIDLDMNLIRLDYMMEIQKLLNLNIETFNSLKEPYLKEKLIELKSMDAKPEDFQKKEDDLIKLQNQRQIELNRYKAQFVKDEKDAVIVHEKQMEEFNEVKKLAYTITGGNKNDEVAQKKQLNELQDKIQEISDQKERLDSEQEELRQELQQRQIYFQKRKIQLEEEKRKLTEKKNQAILQVEDCSKLQIDLEKRIKQMQDKVRQLSNKANISARKQKTQQDDKGNEKKSTPSQTKQKVQKTNKKQ